MGKLIVIEGIDCSGKETQTNLLLEKLEIETKVKKLSFPMYDTPTGKIVGGPYLGKEHISSCIFEEGAVNVNPKVAALYYAADRKYNVGKINNLLNANYNIILNRYVESNMAHQGSKIVDQAERLEMFKWLEKLEYDLLELPRPDLTIFLYMPYNFIMQLKIDRIEKSDQHEASEEHLRNAEKTYLELAELYNFKIVNCIKDNKTRTKEDIHEEIYMIINNCIKN